MLLLALAATASGSPFQYTHSGRLLDGGGLPLTSSHDLTFAIYDAPSGGTQIWSEVQSLSLDQGYFSAVLGADGFNPLDDSHWGQQPLWLGITVDGGTELTRLPIQSVPYAVLAHSVSGGTVDVSEVRINGDVVLDSGGFVGGQTLDSLACGADSIALFDGGAWVCSPAAGSTVVWNDITGIPSDIADGDDDNDTLAAMTCAADQYPVYDGAGWGCQPVVSAFSGAWSDLSGTPAVLDDGDVAWGELVGIPLDLQDGQIAWSELTGVSVALSDGIVDWTELANIPSDLADGDDDTLPGLGCTTDEVARHDGSGWGCHVLSASDVGAIPSGGIVPIADDGAPCSAGTEGSLRYNSGELQLCDGADWVAVLVRGTNDGSSATNPGTSCLQIKTDFPTSSDGPYWIDPGVGSFLVECDMSTGTGGWTVLTMQNPHNYFNWSYSSTNSSDKCGYDGVSTQTDANYVHDEYWVNGGGACTWTAPDIVYSSNGGALTAAQVAGIRADVSELHSSTPLFGADCDSEGQNPGWEAWSQVGVSEVLLTTGTSANQEVQVQTYDQDFQIGGGQYLMPDRFRFEVGHCGNGGGITAGWATNQILIR